MPHRESHVERLRDMLDDAGVEYLDEYQENTHETFIEVKSQTRDMDTMLFVFDDHGRLTEVE